MPRLHSATRRRRGKFLFFLGLSMMTVAIPNLTSAGQKSSRNSAPQAKAQIVGITNALCVDDPTGIGKCVDLVLVVVRNTSQSSPVGFRVSSVSSLGRGAFPRGPSDLIRSMGSATLPLEYAPGSSYPWRVPLATHGRVSWAVFVFGHYHHTRQYCASGLNKKCGS